MKTADKSFALDNVQDKLHCRLEACTHNRNIYSSNADGKTNTHIDRNSDKSINTFQKTSEFLPYVTNTYTARKRFKEREKECRRKERKNTEN